MLSFEQIVSNSDLDILKMIFPLLPHSTQKLIGYYILLEEFKNLNQFFQVAPPSPTNKDYESFFEKLKEQLPDDLKEFFDLLPYLSDMDPNDIFNLNRGEIH